MHRDELRRRAFLARAGQLLGLTIASPCRLGAQQAPNENPFTLGIASGDPAPDGVVLWTRLAPDPMNGGGMPRGPVEVDWQVARDERMTEVVQQGRVTATPDLAHSVHVEVNGLDAARWYWYRFKAGPHASTVGRTRTAPDPAQRLDKLSFAFVSCQHYEQGYYTAYEHMAEEDIDLVVHLGDYIYEGGIGQDRPRRHNSAEIVSLDDYRNRHALYRSDANLQRVHALFPWIVTWDDHELDNNYAADIPEDEQRRDEFLERRANAYQAYYEHMPLRRTSMPQGSSMRLYRRVAFGSLAEFSVLDTRQYRSDQPCGDGNKLQCDQALSPEQTLLGGEQEHWFLEGLQRSQRKWSIIAQQVMMAKIDRGTDEPLFSMDQWSGYEAARRRILRSLHENHVSNPVVLTGDIHSNWVADLKLDFADPKSPTVGSEFVGTSLSSGGDGSDSYPEAESYFSKNPHLHFFNAQRGYVRCVVTPRQWRSDYRVVEYVTRPGSGIKTRASFVVEDGRPGPQPA